MTKVHPIENFLNGDKLKPTQKEIESLFPNEDIMNTDGGFLVNTKKPILRTIYLDFSKRTFSVGLMFDQGISRKKNLASSKEFDSLKKKLLIFLYRGMNEVPEFKNWEKCS